jgi:hypothetical protein
MLRHAGVMELQPYVDSVRQQLMVAAEAGGDEARALAERLVAPLESAMRLTLLSALSNAADEITRDLAPGSVDLRLRGIEPSFVVTAPRAEWDDEPTGAAMTPTVAVEAEDGVTARINFRPPENLKTRIDEAASREGLSVNAWLVRAVGTVLNSGGARLEPRSASGPQSFTGWVR